MMSKSMISNIAIKIFLFSHFKNFLMVSGLVSAIRCDTGRRDIFKGKFKCFPPNQIKYLNAQSASIRSWENQIKQSIEFQQKQFQPNQFQQKQVL